MYVVYRWWPSRSCPDLSKPSADETSELSIDSVAGVFFILLGGIALAGIVCGFEHFAKVVKKAAKTVGEFYVKIKIYFHQSYSFHSSSLAVCFIRTTEREGFGFFIFYISIFYYNVVIRGV